MPTVPTASPATSSGRVSPGRTPRRAAACSALCEAGIRVRTTSTDASWKDPNRVGSLEPMTVPSGSVIRMPSPVTAAFSAATDWASDEVSMPASCQIGRIV